MMEMLTDYKYTIDYTNDAGGASETWGTEAGHGIISASQMLRWVESNCPESCSGEATATCCQHLTSCGTIVVDIYARCDDALTPDPP